MTNLKKHKWADVIHAYAEGEEVEYKFIGDIDSRWIIATNPSFDSPLVEWRIKPKYIIEKWRMALTKYGVIAVDVTNSSIEDPAEYGVTGFISWVGDCCDVKIEK